MAKIIGTVKSISGKANITRGGNQVHALKAGEVLHENDIIQTLQAGAKVVLMLEGGRELTLNGNDQILLDESVFAVLEEGEVIDGKTLHQLIADKFGNPAETAAGDTTTSDANAGAEYASRNDARGSTDSGGTFSDRDSNALGVNFNAIQNENFAPEAFDDSAIATEEGQGSEDQYDAPVVASGNLLDNDTDDLLPNPPADLDVTAVISNDTENPTNFENGNFIIVGKYGTLVLNGETGAYTYTVDENNEFVNALNLGDSLSEKFGYVVSDSGLDDSAVLTITINGSNDAPIATTESGTSTEGNEINAAIPATGNVLTNASDVDNTTLSVVSVNEQEVSVEGLSIEGTYGRLVINADGSYTYTPYAPDSSYENAANTNALYAGEIQHDIFTYTISDNESGGEKFATGTLDITITGINDQPVVSNVIVTTPETDGTQTFKAQLVVIDPDAADNHTFQQIGDATVVASNEIVQVNNFSVEVDPDGAYRVNGNFDALAAGETAIVTFTYTATDDSGSDNATSDEKTVTLTVMGTNDQPVVSDVNVNGTGSGGETGTSLHDVHNVAGSGQVGSVEYTYFTIHESTTLSIAANSSGSNFMDTYIYLLKADGNLSTDDYITSNDDYYGLNSYLYITLQPGEYVVAVGAFSLSLDEVISGINQSYYGNAEATLIFTANHNITLHDSSSLHTVIYESNGVETIYTGQLELTSDLDTSDTHTFQQFGTATAVTDSGAVITGLDVTVATSGEYTINGNFDALAEGETATVTFQYVANDGKGFDGTDGINKSSISNPKTVTLTVTGTNDTPTITAEISNGAITEASSIFDLVATNTFVFADLDTTDTHTVISAFKSGTYTDLNGNVVSQSEIGSITALTISDDTTGDNSGQVTWEYKVNDTTLQYLAEDETVELVYTISVSDNHGGSVNKDIAITITGTNDTPVISDTSVVLGEAKESSTLGDESIVAGTVASGTLVSTDVDHGATATWSGDAAGTYGSFIIDPSTGAWTYTVDDSTGSAADRLTEGQIKTETFTATVTDEKGATATQDVTITVIGSNDAPIAIADSGSVTEMGSGSILRGELDLGTPLASGNVLSNDTDVDNTNTALDVKAITSDLTTQTDSSANILGNLTVNGAYGSLAINQATGVYLYTLSNSNSTVNALHESETLTDTFTYIVSDKQTGNPLTDTAVLTITITGTNDAPVISGNSKGTATEAGNLDDGTVVAATVATGILSAADVDHDTTVTWSGNAAGTYGNFAIDPSTGVWTYTVDATPGSAADKLAEGATKTERFTVLVTDNDPINPKTDTQTVTVKIIGTNDVPVAIASEMMATEDTIIYGNVSATDVDAGETNSLTYSLVDPAPVGLTFNTNGSYSFDANNYDYLSKDETQELKIAFTATDIHNATSSVAYLTITITGTNDAPIAVNDKVTESYTVSSINYGGSNGWNGATITPIGGVLYNNNGQLGVRVNALDDRSIDNTGTDEAIQLKFTNLLQHAEIKLGGFNTQLIDVAGRDTAVWTAMMGATVIASGTYTGGDDSTLVIDTGIRVFDTLIIGTPTGSGSDFYIDSIKGYSVDINSALTLMKNTALTIEESYLIDNDTDIDHNDILNITAINATGTIGEVHLDTDGNVIYDPVGRFDHLAAGEIAHDTFTYTLSDGIEESTATVTVNIIGSDSSNDGSVTMLASSLSNYDGGDGYDSVTLTSIFAQTLDFDNISSKLHNIEHLDLNSLIGKMTINDITPDNVANMTDSDHVLKISGEADDILQLNGFTKDEAASVNLEGYNVYSGTSTGGAEITLHIDQDITHIIP